MRSPLLAAPLLLATLLAGCLDAESEAGPGGGGALDEDAPFLAYQASAADEEKARWWVFAVRPNGTAIRFEHVDDRSAAIRMGTGIDHPVEEVRALFEWKGGNQNRSAGGTVVMLERGTVPPAAMARLRAALQDWPTVPGRDLDSPGDMDVVRFREGGEVDVLRVPPAKPEHRELLDAFRLAQEGMETEEILYARDQPPPEVPPEATCPRMGLTTDAEAFVAGTALTVTATLENCGDAPLTLGQDACGPEPAWRVDVALRGRSRTLLPGAVAGAARMHDPVCEGAPMPITVAPGEVATLVRRWNGTVAECEVTGACGYTDAAGEVTLMSYLSGQRFPGSAAVTVVPREGERTRLLVVKEHDWANGTAEERLRGDFGPHCAPARYTVAPPSVTFRVYEDTNFSVEDAVVVRDFRDGERPENVVTFSADRLDYAWVEGNVTLASPFDPDLPLARVEAEGEDFLVDGHRVPPGGTHTLRANATLAKRGGAYEVTSILVFRNVGPAMAVTERGGICM